MDLDFDLGFLDEVASLVDRRLDQLEAECQECPDPDAYGLLESIDHMVGLGFATSQHYLVATAGWYRMPKDRALSLGPVHRTGLSFAAAVNAAANYWKHSPEWTGKRNEEGTKAALSILGVSPESELVAAAVLHKLLAPLPNRFGSLLPFLEDWRRTVQHESRS